MRRLVLAGATSGSGKTTLAVGLMAAFRGRGLRVQGFKAGPDYIDPGYHQAACGRPSRNLDTWMLDPAINLGLFARAAAGSDLSVVEGVMGLFDGVGPPDADGSTAGLARLLGAPVVLIINARGMAQSAAAVVHGYRTYSSGLNLAGVIFNQVGSPGHYELLREAVEALGGLRCYGYLPRDRGFSLPERHLGLVPHLERDGLAEFLRLLEAAVSQTIDLDGLWKLAGSAPAIPAGNAGLPAGFWGSDSFGSTARIGVARDEAFSFYYQDNLDLLEDGGAELVEFSPLRDERLPQGLDGLIFGGGFPEVFRRELAANRTMREDIRRAAALGAAVYAECGGLMYLSQGIADESQEFCPMAGVIPGRAVMGNKRAALGYTFAVTEACSPLGDSGTEARGHEFHWSTLEEDIGAERSSSRETGEVWRPAYRAVSPRRPEPRLEGLTDGRILAGYTHLHFGSNPRLARNFVEACRRKGKH